MRQLWSVVLLGLVLSEAILAVPTTKKSKTKQADKANAKPNTDNKQTEYKYASSVVSGASAKSVGKTEQEIAKQDVKETQAASKITHVSSQLQLSSDKATEQKLLRMLNNGKDSKLSFPKSYNHKDTSDVHEKTNQGVLKKSSYGKPRPKPKATEDKYGYTKKASFNVLHVKYDEPEQKHRQTYGRKNTVKGRDHRRPHRRRHHHYRPHREEEYYRDEYVTPKKHYRPERYESYDREGRHYEPRYKNQKEAGGHDEEKRKQEQSERLKRLLPDFEAHPASRQLTGGQHVFHRSYNPMQHSSHGYPEGNSEFRHGLGPRPFRNMGIFSLGSEDEFSPDY